jgi:type I restriction enzyme M protein
MKKPKVKESTPTYGADAGRLEISRRADTIWSPIRQMWLAYTPEEGVRQEYLCVLVNEYGFKLDQIAEEMGVVGRGSAQARADFVIWRTAQDKADEKSPLIIVECKANNVTIDHAVYCQGENYARLSNARFFVTHNCRETKFWRVLHDKMPKNIEEIEDIPHADASDKEIEELIKKLKVFKEDEFADLLHQCHNIIRNSEHLDPTAAFDEIAKILFMKVCFERRLARGRYRRNLFTAEFLDEQAVIHQNPIAALFDETKKEYEADYIFDKKANIDLRFPTVREIVKRLERYNLSDTSEDVKGIAFERFLGKTFRDDNGEFFTPRTIVTFMVEMVDPKFEEVICDPASGSGGFLIRYFSRVREQLLARADAEYAAFKAGIEKKKGWSKARKAKALRDKYDWLQRDLDPKIGNSSMWQLANRCIYGTDANDRMARTSKMNMIMHGDGHGGVHHWNGFLNVNGIFEGRFDVILTNPPFGANVGPSNKVELPPADEWEESKRHWKPQYGQAYTDAAKRIEAAKGKPIASLFELPKRGNPDKSADKFGKIKTELLFIERCLNLLKPGGRLGIVLPEGVFNNPSLAYVREFCEDRAYIRAVVSLPQDAFFSTGASVKTSLLFMQRYSEKEQAKYDAEQKKAQAETEAKYSKEIKAETDRLTAEIETAKKARDVEKRKAVQKVLADYERAMAEKTAAEARALLKARMDYLIFMYEAAHVGITATGEADSNELYPNDELPPGIDKSCLELYRQFRKSPDDFAKQVNA